MISKIYKESSTEQLQVRLSIIGMLVACWIMYIQQGWINDDSVLYFEAARLFAAGEWNAGLSLFPWPLYSLLIASVHFISGFSLHNSAQILNAIFIFITFYSLLRIIILASGDKLTLIIATTLLSASSYIFGDVVGMLLRDQGFWAFMLTALVFFIKFYRDGQLEDAIYWQLFALLAMLFRLEAFTYIALLPFFLLTVPETNIQKRLKLLLKAHLLNITASILIVIFMLMHESIQLTDLGRIREIFSAFSDIERNFSSHITKRADLMASHILGEPLESFALSGLLLTLILVVITKCALVCGLVPSILAATNYKNLQIAISRDTSKILLLTMLIVMINGLLIILKVNILSSRYVILFGLITIIFASFSARGHIEKWQKNQLSKYVKVLLGLALIVTLSTLVLNVLPKHAGYNYQKIAADFVNNHNTEHKKVFYVSPRARYYAGEPYADRGYDYWEYTQTAINNGTIYDYDYLVINLDIDENTSTREQLLKDKLSDYTLIKVIYGYKNKKRMLIYKKSGHE